MATSEDINLAIDIVDRPLPRRYHEPCRAGRRKRTTRPTVSNTLESGVLRTMGSSAKEVCQPGDPSAVLAVRLRSVAAFGRAP